MNLVRTSILSLLSTSIKMLAGLIAGKLVAITAGPSGLATIGQFQNFVQVVLTIAKGGLDTGITKYTAEYREEPDRRAQLFSTAARICAASCAIVSAALILFAPNLAEQFLDSARYAYIIKLFGATISLFVLNSVLLAIVNGLHEVRTYILVNIAQSVLTLALTVGLIAWLGLDGALIALATNQSLVLVVLLWMLRGHATIRWRNFKQPFGRSQAIQLVKFSAMTTVSAVLSPVTAIIVRDQIVAVAGADAAGYWQAIWYVSTAYLTVVTTSLAVYYLPKLSATTDPAELRAELALGAKVILPVVAFSALAVFLARELIVRLLFTESFLPMTRLFAWMMLGDVIKIASWLLSYLMLAKAMTRAFIATEIMFSASFVALAYVLLRIVGLVGVTYAYTVNYALYLAAVTIITRPYWRRVGDQ